MRDFLAVARLGSLSRAAESLDVNASTVGRRIETLENALGMCLFQRAQTGYVLTDEGESLVSRAERVEEAAITFERRADASDVVSGRVRLATAENLANFLLIPALPALTVRHPNLTVEIVTSIRSANLHSREADLALRLVRPIQGNVTIRRIGMMRYGLYGSRTYLEGSAIDRIDAGRLDHQAFVVWSDPYADLAAAQWVERVLEGCAPALVVSSLFAQLVAAREGIGLAILPHFLARTEPTLQHIPTEADTIEQPLWLAVHSDLVRSARVRAMAEFVEAVVNQSHECLTQPSC